MSRKSNAEISNEFLKMQITDGKELCKWIRSELKLNQSEFGKLVGFSSPNIRICKIENGKEPLSNIVRQSMILVYLIDKTDKKFISDVK